MRLDSDSAFVASTRVRRAARSTCVLPLSARDTRMCGACVRAMRVRVGLPCVLTRIVYAGFLLIDIRPMHLGPWSLSLVSSASRGLQCCL